MLVLPLLDHIAQNCLAIHVVIPVVIRAVVRVEIHVETRAAARVAIRTRGLAHQAQARLVQAAVRALVHLVQTLPARRAQILKVHHRRQVRAHRRQAQVGVQLQHRHRHQHQLQRQLRHRHQLQHQRQTVYQICLQSIANGEKKILTETYQCDVAKF